MTERELATQAINTIRTLSIDAVQKANSGHPGLPLGAAPMAYVLWHRHLKHFPKNPDWPDRDRFVLSAGHGSMLLYSLLHLAGYDLSIDDLRAFRQRGSKTPGHPESFVTPGVEATTGPLGQGSANAVGMAMAERALAHRFNRPNHEIVDHRTFALVSDGDLMEGVSTEAASLAGHLGLGKLIYLYDDNDVTLDGPTSLAFSGEDVLARYAAYGWQVLDVRDGDTNIDGIDSAIATAIAESNKPSLIRIKTTIGYGSPNRAGTSQAHGSPLGPDELALTKKALGWTSSEPFHVPESVVAHMAAAGERGAEAEKSWKSRFANYSKEFPELAEEWQRRWERRLPEGWDIELPSWKPGESVATRSAAGAVQNQIAKVVPELIGGDADLGGSTKTVIKDGGDFDGRSGAGRNIRFGVREHAMGAICNGMDYHGAIRPFAATFFCFSDYMRPSVRIAALNGQPAIYLWTHDSIGLGEDGPTHQPVEHLMALRAMPNLHVYRPADANEARECWQAALQRTEGPSALVLSRQNLPVLERSKEADARRGAYVVQDSGEPARAIVIATGSEVQLAVAAQKDLAAGGIPVRVVSMPCWKAFMAQPKSYQDTVLPPELTARVSVEAGVTLGWQRWVGAPGATIGVDTFGASAPAEVLMKEFGITADAIAEAVKAQLG